MIGPGVFVLVGLWIPASAALAGGVLWFNTRGETLEDGALVRQFMLLLVVAALLLYGIGTRDFVRMRVDPLYRETQLFARHPLPSAMKQWNEADARRLENVVVERLARGGTTAQGLRDARRFLESTGAHMLGFGDDAARLAWARAELEGLREQQARDPEACYRALAGRPLDPAVPAGGYSEANTAALHTALADLYLSAARGGNGKRLGAGLDEGRAAYASIRAGIVARWGEAVFKRVTQSGFPYPPREPPEAVCEARIWQIESLLELPEPLAGYLVFNLLGPRA